MSIVVSSYLVYLLITVAMVIWVARTLSRHGEVFLADVFPDHAELAHAVNRLLVIGFYLLNLGYVALALRIAGDVPDARVAIEFLSAKVGAVLLVLGAVHLANVYVLSRVRRRRLLERQPRPSIPPSGTTAPGSPYVWHYPPPPVPPSAPAGA